MQAQHTLLHSKLWTRRWPNLRNIVRDICIAAVPSTPKEHKAAFGLRMISFPTSPEDLTVSKLRAATRHPEVPLPTDPLQEAAACLAKLESYFEMVGLLLDFLDPF